MTTLCVYIEPDCWNCNEARVLAQEIAAAFPQLNVQIVEMVTGAAKPDYIFATPTFILNDRVISLGNPTREALRDRIMHALVGD